MLKSIFEQFADLIYKQKCVVCGCSKTNEILCKNCLKTVHNLSPFAQKIIEGVNIFCAFKYDKNIKIIIEQANIPVVVDAGIGVPSDASLVMEAGADFCLINTAIAKADDPVKMAEAFKYGVMAGRYAYEAGRIPKKAYASASSPLDGIVGK